MAARIKVFHATTLVVNGVDYHVPFGSQALEIAEKEIADGRRVVSRRLLVPAGESVTAWEWSETQGFTYMLAQIDGGEGYLDAAVRYNAPTSEDDLTPVESIHHWQTHGLSCYGVFERNAERALIHATAATAVGQTGEVPSVWSSVSQVDGVCDRLAFFNADPDNDVTVHVLVVGK